MDERYGYAGSKKQPLWEATAIEPKSRLLIDFVVGRRDESLTSELMESTRKRLSSPKDLVLMSDGHSSYESLFPSIFTEPYPPARKGARGRFPKERYRINRSLAHLQVIKRRQGRRVVEVKPRVGHGSWKRVHKELERLGYNKPNLQGHRAPEWHLTEDECLPGQEELGLRAKRGESRGSRLVEWCSLQLLPRAARAKRAIE